MLNNMNTQLKIKHANLANKTMLYKCTQIDVVLEK